MSIKKCQWKYGKLAPVMFMIDDYANKYMITKEEDDKLIGADWGGLCFEKGSLLDFLDENLLSLFPYIKTTLFLVVGRRTPIIMNGNESVTLAANESEAFRNVVKKISQDERFEIAYHGLTHGEIIDGHFRQEWTLFNTVEEALCCIERGKSIYKTITDAPLYGGKYCGYESNCFSDKSIAQSGFLWWCRHWDGNLVFQKKNCDGIRSLDIEMFDDVVDIPSTIDGSMLSLKLYKHLFKKKYIKSIYYLIRYGITIEKILNQLINRGCVISIQEHSSPLREDDKRQMPNIIDDVENLQYIFSYLKKYDLWYATGHEIAEYYKLQNETNIVIDNGRLVVKSTNDMYNGMHIWVKSDRNIYDNSGRKIENNESNSIKLVIGNTYSVE